MSPKITADHLARAAIVYVRQSTMLGWQVRLRRLVEIGLTAVGVPDDEAVPDPPLHGALTNCEPGGDLRVRQHPAVP